LAFLSSLQVLAILVTSKEDMLCDTDIQSMGKCRCISYRKQAE